MEIIKHVLRLLTIEVRNCDSLICFTLIRVWVRTTHRHRLEVLFCKGIVGYSVPEGRVNTGKRIRVKSVSSSDFQSTIMEDTVLLFPVNRAAAGI